MKVIGTNKQNGTLVDITVQVEDEASRKAYRAALNGVTCPKCGALLKPKESNMFLVIKEPLTGKFGIDTATLSTQCQMCKHPVTTIDEYDVNAFTDVPEFLRRLRFEYQQREIAERRSKNGQA